MAVTSSIAIAVAVSKMTVAINIAILATAVGIDDDLVVKALGVFQFAILLAEGLKPTVHSTRSQKERSANLRNEMKGFTSIDLQLSPRGGSFLLLP